MKQQQICVLYAWGFLFLAFSHLNTTAANLVSRSIYLKSGAIIVEDTLRITKEFAERESETWRMFQDVKSGTNALESVRNLLRGESLYVQSCDCKFNANVVSIHCVSTLVIGSNGAPANLRWIASWGGEITKFQETHVNLGLRQTEMLVYKVDNIYFLWFPDLGPADGYLEQFDFFKESYNTIFSKNEFDCNLGLGNSALKLLSRRSSPEPQIDDAAELNKLSKMHTLSCNDLISMCTTTKIAKGGYYTIGEQ